MNEMEIRDKFLRGNRLKINLAWLLTIAIIACTIIFSFRFFGEPGSNKAHRNGWVYDSDGLLSDSTISEINAKNNALYSSVNSEIVVAIEKDNSKNKNLPKRAEELFKQYKVSDNGVLLIVAVPDNTKSNAGEKVGEFLDSVFESEYFTDLLSSELYAYSYCLGRNVDYTLGDMIEQKFESAFYEYYDRGNYNGAILSMFDDIYVGYFGGSISNTGNNTTYTVTDGSYYSETRVESRFISTIAIAVLGIFMIMVFSKRRRTYTPSRVYRSPSWFGLGLGMGLGMNRRHHHNHRPHNHGGFGGSFFNGMNGNSGSNRTGGGSRSGGSSFGNSGRTGGGFRSGGSSSGRSGGSFRSGGSSSGRSGGGFRGGGGSGSRGGGGRRR